MTQDGMSNWPPKSKKDENIEVEYTGNDPKVGITFENAKETLSIKHETPLTYETPTPQETFMPFAPEKDFNQREAVLARLDAYKKATSGEVLASERDPQDTHTKEGAAPENAETTKPGHGSEDTSNSHGAKHAGHKTEHGHHGDHGHANEGFVKKWGKRTGGLIAGIFGSIFYLLGHMWKHMPHFDLGNGLDSGGGGGGKKKAPAHH
jgi:hypothetical protein